jgi:hypothetical protein
MNLIEHDRDTSSPVIFRKRNSILEKSIIEKNLQHSKDYKEPPQLTDDNSIFVDPRNMDLS